MHVKVFQLKQQLKSFLIKPGGMVIEILLYTLGSRYRAKGIAQWDPTPYSLSGRFGPITSGRFAVKMG